MSVDSFVSFEKQWKKLLSTIICDPLIHAKWLNTLSYLENCGARKIATCEHPTKVKEEMLKHASEEFRHAHYLKSQIKKVSDHPLKDYSLPTMIGGFATLHYLQALDVLTCRYLKEQGLSSLEVRELAYIFVTYAIELRASELYPLYHEILKETKCKVAVKSILLEEEEHLAEMKREVEGISGGKSILKAVCAFESHLCQNLLQALEASLSFLDD